MNQTGKSARSTADFISLSGIGPELASFVDEFVKSPEQFIAFTVEERLKIENQTDAICLRSNCDRPRREGLIMDIRSVSSTGVCFSGP